MLLSSCAEQNTRTSADFSTGKFEKVAVGAEKKDVEDLLGLGISYYTHVIYWDGTDDNYMKILTYDSNKNYKLFRYVGVHSSPVNINSDYRVYEVFYDQNWRVSGKQTFVTD